MELEMFVFSAGGICFGAEVGQIVSIIKSPKKRSVEQCGGIEKMDCSTSLVDLTMRSSPGANDDNIALLVDTSRGLTGACVESITGIVEIPLENITPLPEFLKSRMETDCIWGIAKLGQELAVLVDLDRYVLSIKMAMEP